MALGTMTRVTDSVTRLGSKRMVSYDVVLGTGSSYPTGGETVTPAMVGFGRRIENVLTNGIARATSGGATARTVAFDFATTPGSVKVQVMTTASAEAANNSDQSAFSIRLTFVGR
jgi:hypothetical protein